MNRILFFLVALTTPCMAAAQIQPASHTTIAKSYGSGIEHPVPYSPLQSAGESSSRFWVSTGLGPGTAGLAALANISRQQNANLFSLRGSMSGRLFDDDFWGVGLLYGRATRADDHFASLSAGVGLVGGTKREGGLFTSEPAERIPATFGLALESQFFLRPLELIGVGVSGFANINGEASFAGLAVCLQVGIFR